MFRYVGSSCVATAVPSIPAKPAPIAIAGRAVLLQLGDRPPGGDGRDHGVDGIANAIAPVERACLGPERRCWTSRRWVRGDGVLERVRQRLDVCPREE